MNAHGNDWTPERTALAIELNAIGLSRSVIAERLLGLTGGSFTRSAVIGKLKRMGIRPLDGGCVVSKRKYAPARKTRPIVVPPSTAPHALFVPLLDARRDQCRFICSGAGETAAVCGHQVVTGRSWCPYHYSIVFLPPKTKQGAAA